MVEAREQTIDLTHAIFDVTGYRAIGLSPWISRDKSESHTNKSMACLCLQDHDHRGTPLMEDMGGGTESAWWWYIMQVRESKTFEMQKVSGGLFNEFRFLAYYNCFTGHEMLKTSYLMLRIPLNVFIRVHVHYLDFEFDEKSIG